MPELLTFAVAAPSSLDVAPRGTEEAVVTVAASIAFVACLAMAIRSWTTEGSPLALAMLAGGCLAVFQEPMVDVLGAIYVRSDLTVFETWGREMPVWAVLAYGIYWGFQPFMLARMAHRGLTVPEFRRLIGACFVLNLLIEWPALGLGVYEYFGTQPFEVLGLPLQWLVINCAGMTAVAAVAHRFRGQLEGGRAAIGALIAPVAVPAASMGTGLAVFSALHSDGSDAALWITSAVTMAIGLVVIELLGRTLASPDPAGEESRPTQLPSFGRSYVRS